MLRTVKRTLKVRHSFLQFRLLCDLTAFPCQTRLNIWRNSRRYNSGGTTLTLDNTFKCYELDKGPPMDVELTRGDALKMYKQMVEVRRIEIVCGNMYKAKHIRGFCHLYNGQEAVAVGMCAVLGKKDSVITAYRGHAWTYLMGVSTYGLIGELVGVKGGSSRGKGGSMHLYSENFYGGNGIVGAQVPLGAGVALAHHYRKDGGVCVTLYGDGAANQGQVFEAFNMAKLWNLPCIFVCENNSYAMGTHVDRHAANPDFYMRGQYIPGLWVDGNQVLAVRSAAQFAVDYAREKGPIVLEMYTYRYEGHSMSDPGKAYRTRDEVKKVREERDPIESFRQQILALCLADEEELKKIDMAVRKAVDAVSKKVLTDREVGLDELTADVYSKNMEPKIRNITGYTLDHKRISEVCFGKPRRTPADEIKDVPIGDAALLSPKKKAKDSKKDAKAAKDGTPDKSDKAKKPEKGEKAKKPEKGEKAKKPEEAKAAVKPVEAKKATKPAEAKKAVKGAEKAKDKPKIGDKPKT